MMVLPYIVLRPIMIVMEAVVPKTKMGHIVSHLRIRMHGVPVEVDGEGIQTAVVKRFHPFCPHRSAVVVHAEKFLHWLSRKGRSAGGMRRRRRDGSVGRSIQDHFGDIGFRTAEPDQR